MLLGLFCLYSGFNSIITGSAGGIGIIPDSRSINPNEDFFEYWFVVALELYVGFLAIKYLLLNKPKDD